MAKTQSLCVRANRQVTSQKLWSVDCRHGGRTQTAFETRRLVQKLKPCPRDRAGAKVPPISKIGHAIFVYCGAAMIITKEVERIDEFRADGRREGYQSAFIGAASSSNASRSIVSINCVSSRKNFRFASSTGTSQSPLGVAPTMTIPHRDS